METNMHCTNTASRADSDSDTPLFPSMDTCSDHSPNACVSIDLDICNLAVAESQSTHGASMQTAESVTIQHNPRPTLAKRPVRVRRRPARFLETVQARRLINRNSAARACCCLACCDVTAAGSCQSGCSTPAVQSYRVSRCRSLVWKKVALIGSIVNMPRSRILRRERPDSDSESSESGSGLGMAFDRSVALHTGRSGGKRSPAGSSPVPEAGAGDGDGSAGTMASAAGPTVSGWVQIVPRRRCTFHTRRAQIARTVACSPRARPIRSI